MVTGTADDCDARTDPTCAPEPGEKAVANLIAKRKKEEVLLSKKVPRNRKALARRLRAKRKRIERRKEKLLKIPVRKKADTIPMTL